MKPCPFCGATPFMEKFSGLWNVRCRNRGCITPNTTWRRKVDAVLAWNTRTNDIEVTPKKPSKNTLCGILIKLEIENTDLLFIDTDHTYDQCSKELQMHAHKVRKYLIFHDTNLVKDLNRAISEFIEANKEWKIKEVLTNNNGLTVLERTV
jgi:hypothetical protein